MPALLFAPAILGSKFHFTTESPTDTTQCALLGLIRLVHHLCPKACVQPMRRQRSDEERGTSEAIGPRESLGLDREEPVDAVARRRSLVDEQPAERLARAAERRRSVALRRKLRCVLLEVEVLGDGGAVDKPAGGRGPRPGRAAFERVREPAWPGGARMPMRARSPISKTLLSILLIGGNLIRSSAGLKVRSEPSLSCSS